MIEKLKELVNKHNYTKVEKAWIVDKSKELGLEFYPEKGCSNCWNDQVNAIYRVINPIEVVVNSEADYVLKPHIDFILHGVRYNNATLDEKKAKYLLSLGFGKWFLKIKDENNTEDEVG